MNTKSPKISALFLLASMLYLSCNDNNIMNIYNKYTEGYRKAPEDLLIAADTSITVRVLSSHTDKPIANARVTVTKPAGDTLTDLTGVEGIAVIYTGLIKEGTYSVRTALCVNGTELSRKCTYYLYEKNNTALTIYIDERSRFR
jgi:hypothetical protein